MSDYSIRPIDSTLSGPNTPSQSGPESDGNGGVLCILQNSSITVASPSDCLVSYPERLLAGGGGSYLTAEMHLVYSTAPTDLVY